MSLSAGVHRLPCERLQDLFSTNRFYPTLREYSADNGLGVSELAYIIYGIWGGGVRRLRTH